MKTIQEIRRHNLILLVREAEEEIGVYGAAAHLARLTDVKTSQISQFKNAKTHANGRVRAMGDDVARKMESGTGKQKGWMDKDHTEAATVSEAELLDRYRECSEAQRQALLETLRQFSPPATKGMES